MKYLFFIRLVLCYCLITCGDLLGAEKLLVYKRDNFLFDFSFINIAEGFFEHNVDYFSGNSKDQSFYVRSTWDFTSHAEVGDVWKSKVTLRNKVNWGTTQAIITTQERRQVLDSYPDTHSHGFNRLVPWFRKAWVKFNLNDAFDVNADNRHYLKIGIFPFEVGRGIALGDAYAITPGILGFNQENVVDQYAWGVLWHGDLSHKYSFTYDIYGAIDENLSTSVRETTQKVNTQCLQCNSVYRGFGKINFILAGRSMFTLFNDRSIGQLTVEPYVVYNHAPMQYLEFSEDSNSKLGTFGIAIEYNGPQFELGFESAVNTGRQIAKAWDRNQIFMQRGSAGSVQEVYSEIYADKSYSKLAVVNNTNKAVVESDTHKCATFNGKRIGHSDLYNSEHRFRSNTHTRFDGFMAVADAAYWLRPEQLRIAIAGGYASGDEHPHVFLEYPVDVEVDGIFSGFIGLQELYSGKRVVSLFAIGDQGTALPLSIPVLPIDEDYVHYPLNVHGFSNIIYLGMSLQWKPQGYKRQITITPNALYYWVDAPGNAYCLACRGSCVSQDAKREARKALGLEVNMFADVQWLESIKGFLAVGFFVPGSHFTDITGRPTNVEQYNEVTRASRCGIDDKSYPLMNNKVAWVVNGGFFIEF